jgi:hypothetical protein
MSVTPIKNLGQGGMNKDTEAILLPPNVFTDAYNVRFRNGSVGTILGESAFLTAANTPEKGMHWRRPDAGYTVLAYNGYINRYAANGTATAMLASAGYAGSVWQTDQFGAGYAILFNNGVDTPLYSLYADPVANLTLQPFPGWNYAVGLTVTAKVIKSFNYSLVAANLTLNDGVTVTSAPSTVRISVQAAIGSFPTIWEPGLTTDTADEFEVNTTSPILDLNELRGQMFIYSSDSIHVLSLANGIASIRPYSRGYGVLAQDCIAEFDGQHFVVDRNDIYTHNGSGKITSIAYGRVRDFFFGDINDTYANKTHVVKNTAFKEMWVCYVSTANVTSKPDKALVYNYQEDNWTVRALPNTVSMFPSPNLSGATWQYGNERILAVSGTSRVYLMDSGNQMYNTTTNAYGEYTSYVERVKLSAEDPFGNNYISGLAPVLTVANYSDIVTIFVTAQNVYDKPANYSNPDGRDKFDIQPQDEAKGYKVDPRSTGRFLNYKVTSEATWTLPFVGLEMKPANRR